MNVKHILVPLDLSTKNEQALATAAEMAEHYGARVTLLHVVQRIEHIPTREVQGFVRRLEQRAQRRLALAAKRLVAKGVRVTQIVLIGTPARDIVKHAQLNKVDLIVINSHAVGDPTRPGEGLGTTSYKVALFCRCPVMLLK